jgi:glycosyltransferase involved in cell wall biosynthesis
MSTKKTKTTSFQAELNNELQSFLKKQKEKYPSGEVLKIDLHCHDYNSDVPDELIGRILNVPETWLPTERLIKRLEKNNMTALTITNHNNARSCFEQQALGKDVLVGAEFSCTVPDFNIGIHVLTYGFNQEQEIILNKLRRNVYQFLQYTFANDLPTIWAHPLYHYNVQKTPSFDFLSKMALLFERFEVLNGQRDTWQNILVKNWLENLTPEQIDKDAERFNVDISLYCKNRYKKSFSGGSDSHMGIFSGQTGTYLHIPNLKKRLKTESASSLALEAIKNGDMAPFGTHQNSEKLTVAFLDYFCQIAMYMEDPGMMRILLHKGSYEDKLLAFFVTNAFSELRRHKVTMRFIELFHNCFIGKVPSKRKRLLVPKTYKPIFDAALKIAKANDLQGEEMNSQISQAVNSIIQELSTILFSRIQAKTNKLISEGAFEKIEFKDILERLELPSEVRSLAKTKKRKFFGKKMLQPNIATFLDGLPFPLLASSLFQGAIFTSAKVMYANRELLSVVSDKIDSFKHPKRMLWLTDTFEDKNGVSSVLQEMHKEIKRLNLPIDILVCSSTLQSDDHLIVVKPLAEFELPFYKQQPIRVPNLNEIHHLFLENEYDRIMCSTEGIMGGIALYLKQAYSVSASFYVHTDWIMYLRKTMGVDGHNLNRVRRILRAFYNGFDDLFVLNTDQQQWLTSKEMDFNEKNVHLTAHWCSEDFHPRNCTKQATFGLKENDKVLLFAGRLSHEKGVMDLIEIFPSIQQIIPSVKLVFAGTGPAEDLLKEKLPNALFMGWVPSEKLPEIYSSADLLILPSKFDTFSCVVLEALSCGLPVLAYKSKGPKDIITENCGYLATGKNEMIRNCILHFSVNENISEMRHSAMLRAKDYNKGIILKELLENTGLEKFRCTDAMHCVSLQEN